MLAVGELAPDFEGVSTSGGGLRLSSLRGRSVVLYFFPKAGSVGCTRESIKFAHLYPELKSREIELVGVSVDNLTDQQRFGERCQLPFPLIADPEKEIARRFGVLGAFGMAKRVTFFLDREGRVAKVFQGVLPGPHVEGVRGLLTLPPGATGYSRSK
jgi:peroxiredoxin Q/BCP